MRVIQNLTRHSLRSARNLWRSLPLDTRLRGSISPMFWKLYEAHYWRKVSRHHKGPEKGTVKVAGFLSGNHGIAASAHRCIASLRRLGIAVEEFDISGIQLSVPFKEIDHASSLGGAWILHVNAPELVLAYASIGKDVLLRSFVAGYWAWELPRAKRSWTTKAKFLSELWVPSKYTADAFEDTYGVPVRVVPHVFRAPEMIDSASARKELSLTQNEFIAVSFCDLCSSIARKNPMGTIEAFKLAFDEKDDVRLILKTQNGARAPEMMSQLQLAAQNANIEIVDDTWPSHKVISLIAAADVLVSLHRAEGFGLTIAEAMAMGTPVIATAWSGNMDFMSEHTSMLIPFRSIAVNDPQRIYSGQFWADPDIEAAASALKKLYEDVDFRLRLSSTAQASITQILSDEAYAQSLGPSFWDAVSSRPDGLDGTKNLGEHGDTHRSP